MITRRTLLKTTAGSLAALGAGLVGADEFLYPKLENKADGSRIYDYVYGMPKSEAVDFVLANMSDDGRFSFGTSEFYFNADLIPEIALKVFGDNNPGVDMTLIGEPFDQSLWQAIAAGAYGSSGKVRNRKVMVVVSPQWFFKGSGDEGKFYTKVSYSLYRACMQSAQLSDQTKAYLRRRCSELGIDAQRLAAASHDTPLDVINDAAFAAADSWRLRSQIPNIVSLAPTKSATRASGQPTGEPDWDTLLASAEAEGQAACTNNDFGVYDEFWEKNHTYDPELFQNFDDASNEYADFACLLQVCREVGFEPLVCILPVHGQWYDVSNVSSDERQRYYETIREACQKAGASYADFSPYEYERYFLCDTVHPGWKGWVRIEQAFYDFVNGNDDEYLTRAGGR